jgi:hypothetical protein
VNKTENRFDPRFFELVPLRNGGSAGHGSDVLDEALAAIEAPE